MRCGLIGFLLSVLLSTQAFAGSQFLGARWMVSYLQEKPCFLSLFSVPASGCRSWGLFEKAGPSYAEDLGRVYVGGSDKMLHALSSATGELIAVRALPGALSARPLYHQGVLYFGTENGHLMAVDARTLSDLWDIEVDAEITQPVEIGNKSIYAATGLSTLYAVNAETGAVRWTHKQKLPTDIVLSKRAKPLFYSASEDGVIVERVAFAGPSGKLELLNAANGAVLNSVSLGRTEEPFPDIAADPVLLGRLLVVGWFNRGVYALDASTLAVMWSSNEQRVTQIAVDHARVYAAGPKEVRAFSLDSGNRLWAFSFNSGSPTRLILNNGVLYFGSDKSSLFALDINSGAALGTWGSSLGIAADIDLVRNSSSFSLYVVSAERRLFLLTPSGEVVRKGDLN